MITVATNLGCSRDLWIFFVISRAYVGGMGLVIVITEDSEEGRGFGANQTVYIRGLL